MLKSNLAIGAISYEIVESVFKYSQEHNIQLMLICSRNQIDFSDGYFLKTQEYNKFISKMRKAYPIADVVLCRDHCGLGFKDGIEDSINLVKETILCDLLCGFDLIHLDVSRMTGSHLSILKELEKLIEFSRSQKDKVLFEVGTDENEKYDALDLNQVRREVDYISNFCEPEFYVARTGSLVKENRNVGKFNTKTALVSAILHENNIKFKEHNADYLTSSEISKRENIIDAMNIAPQLGIIQTNCLLSQACVYGIDCTDLENHVYDSRKWEKWLYTNTASNKNLCVQIATHYYYNAKEYVDIMNKLSEHVNIREHTISELTKVIDHYTKALKWIQ